MLGVFAFGTGLVCGVILANLTPFVILKKKKSKTAVVSGGASQKQVFHQPMDAELNRRPTFYIPNHAAVLIVE